MFHASFLITFPEVAHITFTHILLAREKSCATLTAKGSWETQFLAEQLYPQQKFERPPEVKRGE